MTATQSLGSSAELVPIGDRALRGAVFVAVVRTTEVGNRDDGAAAARRDGSRDRRILAQRQVRSRFQIEVDNSTPIVLTFAKSAIDGTRGSVVPSQCTRSLSRGSLSAAAAWRLNGIVSQ